jgi:hypothetical protein
MPRGRADGSVWTKPQVPFPKLPHRDQLTSQ